MSPKSRFALFLALGGFFLLGPIYTQVLLRPARSVRKPWLPMHWHMYHGVGVNFCQAQIYKQEDGARVEYSKEELSKAVGRGSPRSRNRKERFKVGRKARSSDVLFAHESELGDVVKPLCARAGSEADVRAEMRCSPELPGGRWRSIEDGGENLCQRTTWKAPPTPGILLPGSPIIDPDTGEEQEAPSGEPTE